MISDNNRNHRLIAGLAFLALVCMPLHASDGDFVGSAACAGCHKAQFNAWRGSHHDLAMQHATAQTVLGDFQDSEITVHGVTSRFFTRDGRFFVRTDGPDGEMADFEIAYTFGVEPLQQYLVPFPDGRIQALGLAWDSRSKSEGGQRWFHLYPDEPIGHGDEFHWTGRQQNWNYMCADCHSRRGTIAGGGQADPLLAVRSEAGRVLAATPREGLDEAQQARLQSAVGDYVTTQRYNADRPESWLNLGNLRSRSGELEQAESDYRHALTLAPDFAPAWLNLADLFRYQSREAEAAEVLKAGLAQSPQDAALHHALGLSLVRRGDSAAALVSLKQAVELAPGEVRYAYVYGVGLNSGGQTQEAIQALTAAHERHPNDVQIMQALALIERDRGDLAAARGWAEEILRVNPSDPSARQLLQVLPTGSE